MDADRDALLEALLEQLDRSEEPDLDALEARFPGRRSELERLLRAARRYAGGGAPPIFESTLEPGARVGDFVVERLLGVGGMGQVYLARQRSLGDREVALKILPDALRSEVNLRRFEREALLLAELHHPRLAEVYGFGEAGGVHFLAMRYIGGPTLREVLKDLASGVLALTGSELEARVRQWALDVAEALATIHAAGLVHRDVKPSNVLLEVPPGGTPAGSGVGRAVLVDFGLVRDVGACEVTLTGDRAATPAYASPEQVLGLEAGPRSDVFSLGATLLDLLGRRMPNARSPASSGIEVSTELHAGLDPDFAAILGKCTESDERWRYPSAVEMLADLRALFAGLGVTARRPPLIERLYRSVHRNPARVVQVVVGSAAAFALAVGGAVLSKELDGKHSLERAWDAGDLVALGDSVDGGRGAWLLRDEALSSAVVQLEAHEDTPLLRILDALRARDLSTALREAATPLRLDGHDAHPVLSRFLLLALSDRGVGLAVSGSRGPALAMVNRLYFERPVGGAAERAASAPFRRLLLELWERADLERSHRLAIAATFSGLGELEDVRWLLAWAGGLPILTEERRLAYSVCDRILRRAMVQGEAAVDPDELLALVLDTATDCYRALAGPSYAFDLPRFTGLAATELARSVGFYRRSLGLEAGVEEMLFPDWRARGIAFRSWIQVIRATTLDPTLVAEIESGAQWEHGTTLGYRLWGQTVGLMGEELNMQSVLASLEEFLSGATEAERMGYLANFENGLLRSRELRAGRDGEFAPDPTTLLGSRRLALVPRVLEHERRAPQLASEAAKTVSRGWLHFEGSTLVAAGDVGDITVRHVEVARSERDHFYLLLTQPGLSELGFGLTVKPGATPHDLTLRVNYQSGSRSYLPFRGTAAFEVLLDGKPVGGEPEVLARSATMDPTLLPAELLVPGLHKVTLRLGAVSNTTFRVYGIAITEVL